MPLLELTKVTKQFGGLTAIKDVSLKVEKGELFGLIGPNGAGKTTLFNLISGIYRPDQGQIHFADSTIHKIPSHEISTKGIARTFQNIRLFGGLTVLENVMVASHQCKKQNLIDAAFHLPKWARDEDAIKQEAMSLLTLLQLDSFASQEARHLPYGSQRRLEIARALATKPQLLLLDEPAAGMNPQESVELMSLIRSLRDQFGIAIMLVEHNMRVVMGVCERLHVLDHGETLAEGSPLEVKNNPSVIEAYLGVNEDSQVVC